MTAKKKTKMWQTEARTHRDFSLATTQSFSSPKMAGTWKLCSGRLPCAFPVAKALESACPVSDTRGDGDFGELSRAVVMRAMRIWLWHRKIPMCFIHAAITNFYETPFILLNLLLCMIPVQSKNCTQKMLGAVSCCTGMDDTIFVSSGFVVHKKSHFKTP